MQGEEAEQQAADQTAQQAAGDDATPGTSTSAEGSASNTPGSFQFLIQEPGEGSSGPGKEQSAFLVDTILNKMDAKSSRKLITAKMHNGKVTFSVTRNHLILIIVKWPQPQNAII